VNLQAIFFFYGLAFLVMGITIFLMPKKNDLLDLSEDLWLVGLFGILHGLNEWVDLLILRGSPLNVPALTVLGAFLLPLSFVPLLQFGIRVLFRGTRSVSSLKYLWVITLTGWAVACSLTRGFLIPGILARYFICLAGTILTAAGMLRVFRKADNKEEFPLSVSVGAIGAVVFFVFYGVLSGLVVPQAPFLMASLVNHSSFLKIIGLPVQFFRMFCAVFLAFSFFMFTGIYAFGRGSMKVERRGGIRRKITILVCSISVTAALLTTGLCTWWVYDILQTSIRQKQFELTQTLSYTIHQMIDQKIQEFQVHSGNTLWKEAITVANEHYAGMSPEAVLKEMQEKDAVWIPAKLDHPLIRGYLATPLSQRLKIMADDDPDVAEIFLTDRSGGLVGASGKTSDFYQADEDWWQKAYAGGKGSVYVGDVEMDSSSGVLSIPVAIPVQDKEGRILGVAKESIGVDVFFAPLRDYKAGRTGHAALIDAKGNIIFHEGVKPLTQKLFSGQAMQWILQRESGSLERPGRAGEETEFISFQYMKDSALTRNGIRWYVCVAQETKEIYEPLRSLVSGMAVLLLVVLLSAVFFGITAGRRFAIPIDQLKIAAQEIVTGKWNREIRIRTGDELQTLGESFNYMVRHLYERQEQLIKAKGEIEALSYGLEVKVEERTRELAESQRATMNILEDLTSAKEELEVRSRELQRSEEFLKKTGEMAKVGGWELDLATQIVTWTDETYRIHELEIGSPLSLDAAIHYYAPESLPALEEALRKIGETGEPFDLELELIPAITKKRIWVRSDGRAIYKDGKIVKLQGTFQDIDARKKAAEALRQSEERLRSITDSAQDAILMMDPKGVISFWNPAAERILGYFADEALGMDLHKLLAPARFHQASATSFHEFLKTGKGAAVGKTLELAAFRKDGVEIPIALSLSAICREDGWHSVGIVRDITERKKMEDAIKKSMLELETQTWGLQKANDGIKALYGELEQKNTELGKLDKLKDDFISIVAHELRNPLAVVREAATLMLDGLAGPVAPEQKVYIDMVHRTSERLIHITNDLLDLAKIESGKVTLHFETIDLVSLVRQACEGITLRTNKKGLTVSEVLPSGKLEIAGDFDKLSQVMVNLLSNAYKFTEKGGITVELKDIGEEVECAVKDTGPGISPGDLAKLFSKFEQFGKPMNAAEKGTGLGLVITKSIVEAHSGRIRVESELGKGATFIMTLPKKQKQKKKLGEILLEEKILTPEQLAEVLRKQREGKP